MLQIRGIPYNVEKCKTRVLIPKSGELQQGIPKARPICLLDEIGKVLERIITGRIHKWIEDRQKDNFWILSNNQYGF